MICRFGNHLLKIMGTNYEVFFSIIVPTYNSGKTLSQTIQSVFGQSFSNYELLIIDGQSKDDTVAIAKSFKADNVTIVSEPDKSIYDAINKGIIRAKGEWIYILGSDDTLYDNSILEKVSKTITQNPQSKIIFGDVYTSDNTIERFPYYTFTELLDRCICQQAIFYHHSLFKDKLFSLDFKMSSDWDFNMQVFTRENHPVYMEQLMANYSLEGTSGNWQTHPEYLNYFKDKKQVIIRYKGKAMLYPYYAWYYIRRYARKINKKLKWMFQ